MREHPRTAEICGHEFLEGGRARAQHHERWDGSGYPWVCAARAKT